MTNTKHTVVAKRKLTDFYELKHSESYPMYGGYYTYNEGEQNTDNLQLILPLSEDADNAP